MKGKIRVAWLLLTVLSLFATMVVRRPVYAGPRLQSSAPATAAISETLEVSLSLTPPVATPRETRTLAVTLTNRGAAATAPAVSLHLPGGMNQRGARLPASTTLNYRENVLNWMPVVPAGEERTLTLPFTMAADLARPEQMVRAVLREGEAEAETALAFWTGLPPVASVNSRPGIVSVGEPVQLVAQVSGPGPFSQSWALGDGRHVVARDPVVVYATPGRYDVRLQVANPLGMATATGAVVVVARPAAAFSPDDEQTVVAQPVQFRNSSAGEPPLSYWWEFGDGQTSTEREPAHAYTAPGSYEVRLLVQSEHGQAESTQMVTVGNRPTADMIVEEATATGRPLQGQAYTDGSVTTVRWEMGNGQQYEGETISHTYYRPGTYTVTMTAANEFGETRVSRQVEVVQDRLYVFLPQVTLGGSSGVAANVSPAREVTTAPVAAADESAPAPVPASVGGAGSLLVEGEETPDAGEPAAEPESAPPVAPTPAPAPELIPPQPQPFSPVALPAQAALDPQTSPAEQLLWYINEARRIHSLPPLAYNYELSIAAQLHTVDMAGNPEIMHDGSDGSRPAERQRRHGYAGAYGGEAVAWGWESPVPVVEFWVNSPPHRALILNPDAREVGVGHTADGTAPNLWYWAAEFGIRLEEPAAVVP